MGELGVKRRGRRWLSVLFAFLLPGMGHMYNGRHAKGLLLLAGLLLDYTAIFRLADSDGGRHLLLIVYLGLLLPVFYFVSVFDVLQMEAKEEESSSLRLSYGISLTTAGAIMLILVKPPAFMLPWMNELAERSVGPLLMLVSLLLVFSIWRAGAALFKLGRMTASILIFVIGFLIIWDQLQGRNILSWLSSWWPVIFMLLGIELILYSTLLRRKTEKLRIDVAGIASALVITVIAYGVTQYADFPVRWLDQFNVELNGRMDYGEEKGFRYDKNVIKAPFDDRTASLRIVNENGDISVRADDVREIELHTTIWVDTEDEAEAAAIADQSIVKLTPGSESLIEVKGQTYGSSNNRIPRINIEVVLPKLEPPVIEEREQAEEMDETPPPMETEEPMIEEVSPDSSEQNGVEGDKVENVSVRSVKLDIESGNGSVAITELYVPGGLNIRSGSGVIQLSQIKGPVKVEAINGNIEAEAISGTSSFITKNGSVAARLIIDGHLYASTLNGDLELSGISGDLDAETKNGKIIISGAASAVKADTLNGNIEVKSSIVGGNWDLDSSVGEIKLIVPNHGNFSVFGSVTFGHITTDLPLEQTRKMIRGTIGQNIHRIHINATNSISIHGQKLLDEALFH